MLALVPYSLLYSVADTYVAACSRGVLLPVICFKKTQKAWRGVARVGCTCVAVQRHFTSRTIFNTHYI